MFNKPSFIPSNRLQTLGLNTILFCLISVPNLFFKIFIFTLIYTFGPCFRSVFWPRTAKSFAVGLPLLLLFGLSLSFPGRGYSRRIRSSPNPRPCPQGGRPEVLHCVHFRARPLPWPPFVSYIGPPSPLSRSVSSSQVLFPVYLTCHLLGQAKMDLLL